MHMGPCGIACSFCRYLTSGFCHGCIRGDLCPPERAAQSLCGILRCAASRQIPYCFRDCPDFPCSLFDAGFPSCWTHLVRQTAFGEAPRFQAPIHGSENYHINSSGGDGLRVFCLGPLRAYRGAEEVQWNHSSGSVQKVKAMFAFLLSRRRQGAYKETIIDFLWPQQRNNNRANSNLHLTVYCLRRALEPELQQGSNSSFVRFRGGRYTFHPRQPFWIDADIFESHYLEASTCERNGELEEAVSHWGSAVDLYTGDYMADIHADYTEDLLHDWCLSRRRRLREHYLAALEKLAGYHLQIGALNVATKYAHQALDKEPAFEPGHRIVMQCLVADGQPELALRQFRLCVAELADSEGRPPSRRTRQIYQSLIG